MGDQFFVIFIFFLCSHDDDNCVLTWQDVYKLQGPLDIHTPLLVTIHKYIMLTSTCVIIGVVYIVLSSEC